MLTMCFLLILSEIYLTRAHRSVIEDHSIEEKNEMTLIHLVEDGVVQLL